MIRASSEMELERLKIVPEQISRVRVFAENALSDGEGIHFGLARCLFCGSTRSSKKHASKVLFCCIMCQRFVHTSCGDDVDADIVRTAFMDATSAEPAFGALRSLCTMRLRDLCAWCRMIAPELSIFHEPHSSSAADSDDDSSDDSNSSG